MCNPLSSLPSSNLFPLWAKKCIQSLELRVTAMSVEEFLISIAPWQKTGKNEMTHTGKIAGSAYCEASFDDG
jgi:hypothetical protein